METDDWLWPHLKPKGKDYSVRYKFRPLQLFAGSCWRYSLINLITINYSISYIWLQYIHCTLVSQNLGWGEHMSCSPKEPQARRIVFLAVCFGVVVFIQSGWSGLVPREARYFTDSMCFWLECWHEVRGELTEPQPQRGSCVQLIAVGSKLVNKSLFRGHFHCINRI